MRHLILTILTILLLPAFPAKSGEIRQELLGGTYLATLRNLKTEGATLAYRIAFLSEPEQYFSLFYPGPLYWGLEARGGFLWKPEDAGEAAILLNLAYDLDLGQKTGIFFLIGGGASYSSADYNRVAKHFNFIERTSIGGRFDRFIVQLSYEHRSNGGIWSPNRGTDLITAELGIEF
jgi:hypothetical protein